MSNNNRFNRGGNSGGGGYVNRGGGAGGAGRQQQQQRGRTEFRIDEQDVPPSRHALFFRGFGPDINTDEIREFFISEIGPCTIDFNKATRDATFIAVRFENRDDAKTCKKNYHERKVFGYTVDLSWYRDIRRYVNHYQRLGQQPPRPPNYRDRRHRSRSSHRSRSGGEDDDRSERAASSDRSGGSSPREKRRRSSRSESVERTRDRRRRSPRTPRDEAPRSPRSPSPDGDVRRVSDMEQSDDDNNDRQGGTNKIGGKRLAERDDEEREVSLPPKETAIGPKRIQVNLGSSDTRPPSSVFNNNDSYFSISNGSAISSNSANPHQTETKRGGGGVPPKKESPTSSITGNADRRLSDASKYYKTEQSTKMAPSYAHSGTYDTSALSSQKSSTNGSQQAPTMYDNGGAPVAFKQDSDMSKFLPFGQQRDDLPPLPVPASQHASSTATAAPSTNAATGAGTSLMRPVVVPTHFDDECELFGRQIATDLRSLPARTRLIARKKIADVMLEIMLAESDK